MVRILRNLKNAPGHELLYKDNGHIWAEAYSKADWVGSPGGDQGLATGYCLTVGGNLVS